MAIVPSASESVPGNRPPPRRWQQAVATAVRDPRELCRRLRLPTRYERAACRAAARFPLLVPLEYVARMRLGEARDPLLRQVLPLEEELDPVAGFQPDPLRESAAARCSGLLQKYRGRALMVTARACAVHCRFCFRRHFSCQPPGSPQPPWRAALANLRQDESIDEVILSGGDPLMLSDAQLADLLAALADVSHLRRVRIHTRLPIVVPQRSTTSLVATLRSTRLPVLAVLHANHPAELDAPVAAGLARWADAGIPLLCQSVLLRGVNDERATLVALSQRLADLRVIPYYLHQLDRVSGAAHFEVPAWRGRQLIAQLQAELPGYAVPRYVRELPGAASKIEIR